MPRSDSSLPELVFLPNHAGKDDNEEGRLKDFLACCRQGFVNSWTCKESVQTGDVYLFWFCSPASILAGIGVSLGDRDELENDEWDWTDAEKGWFCAFEPAITLSQPLTVLDISRDQVLARSLCEGRSRPFAFSTRRLRRVTKKTQVIA